MLMPCEDCERIIAELRAEVEARVTAVCETFERRQDGIIAALEHRLNGVNAKNEKLLSDMEALLANVDRKVRSVFARIEAAAGVHHREPSVH